MNKIVFVILHYKDHKVTTDSINSILNQKYSNYGIVVVDNNSNNNSFESLKQTFSNNDSVYFVGVEYNLGFAKSNDLGYQIAKHKFNADLIVVMNNDIIIEDDCFCEKLNNSYSNKNYDVIGPDIITLDGKHQNPMSGILTNVKQVKKRIMETKVKLSLIRMIPNYKPKKKVSFNGDYENAQSNVPLHGSCLIFGNGFINKHEFPFYPDTFLYAEEDILFNICKKDGLSIYYNPELKVKHLEDVSTSKIVKNMKEKRLFELRNSLKSLYVLRDIIKK